MKYAIYILQKYPLYTHIITHTLHSYVCVLQVWLWLDPCAVGTV